MASQPVGNQPEASGIRLQGWLLQADSELPATLVVRKGQRVWRYQMSPCGYLQPVDRHGNAITQATSAKLPPPHIIDRLDRAWLKLNGVNPDG